MIKPAIPPDEVSRVEALRRFNILDTPPEERFERLTQIAMLALGAPMASVSLIDTDRQWCKSSPGMEKPQVPREISFCGHTILQKEPLIISDAHRDLRFHDNPLVKESPHLRAYVGIPLFSGDGHAIGSFCVLDHKPRDFSEGQIVIMRQLAAVAENEITNAALTESVREAIAAREEAEAADRAKSRFTAVLSHEVRTPLNGIISIADLLAETHLSREQSEYASIIRSSGASLLVLVNDFLDASKMEEGKLELERLSIDLRRFLNETLALQTQLAKTRGVALRSEIGEAVPAFIIGDPFRLRQILLNLVSNALKFTEKGHVLVKVDLASTSTGEKSLTFRVEDTGPGIREDIIGRLFQPYCQADNSISRKFGGTGLGLSICKQLVELMHGRIWIESALGHGSTFAFAIPYLKDPTQAKPASPGLAENKSAPATANGALPRALKILVVDDNSTNLRVAGIYLKKLGYSADFAATEAECLQKMKQSPYDIIFMDMQLEETSGCDVTRRIRQSGTGTKGPWIVALTANAQQEAMDECRESGMNDFLTKPLRLESLRDALDRFEQKA